MRCGNFFHSIAFWRARIATFGTGLWPARLRYVAPSNSCHYWRQSIVGVVAVAMGAPSIRRHSIVSMAGDANKSQIGNAAEVYLHGWGRMNRVGSR